VTKLEHPGGIIVAGMHLCDGILVDGARDNCVDQDVCIWYASPCPPIPTSLIVRIRGTRW
jgi:hypothetical protein